MSEVTGHGYYITIPFKLAISSLPDKAKILFGIIANLSNHKGYCFATNKYIGEVMQVHEQTISKLIGILIQEKYIIRFDEANKFGCERRLFITSELSRNAQGGSAESISGVQHKHSGGLSDITQHNNISKYNKSNKQSKSNIPQNSENSEKHAQQAEIEIWPTFKQWHDTYPSPRRHYPTSEVEALWKKLTQEEREQAMQHTEAMKAKVEMQFIPYSKKYLKAKRFLNDIIETNGKSKAESDTEVRDELFRQHPNYHNL